MSQSGTKVVTKWDRCYKVEKKLLQSGQVLQSGTGVTKNDDCYKVGSNSVFQGERGVQGQKISLAYIKVQPVMELLLFTEWQNLRL